MSMESGLGALAVRFIVLWKVDQPARARVPSLDVCLRVGPSPSESGWSC